MSLPSFWQYHWLFGSRYASCLGYLQKLKPNLLLDVHLYNHVETLYEQIRHKALIQYTAPFISVDLHTMATSFKTSVAGLEKELAALIMENQIQVRQLRLFDQSLSKKILYMFCAHLRSHTQWREFNLSDWCSKWRGHLTKMKEQCLSVIRLLRKRETINLLTCEIQPTYFKISWFRCFLASSLNLDLHEELRCNLDMLWLVLMYTEISVLQYILFLSLESHPQSTFQNRLI